MKASPLTPVIDYQKLADAQAHYASHNFTEIAVPWIISYEAYASTMPVTVPFVPSDRREFYTLDGYLNASGEQGFIELMLAGEQLTRNFCITSCFRDEPILDDIHHRYFVKLELIDMDVSSENLSSMIYSAKLFFDQYLPIGAKAKIVPMDDTNTAFDLVDGKYGIELGSYGIRRYRQFAWIYGTGIALPRLTTVLQRIA